MNSAAIILASLAYMGWLSIWVLLGTVVFLILAISLVQLLINQAVIPNRQILGGVAIGLCNYDVLPDATDRQHLINLAKPQSSGCRPTQDGKIIIS